MAVTVTIKSNVDEVLDEFNNAKDKMLLDIGLTVQSDAAANSPVRTGALRKSWTVEVNKNESAVYIGVPLGELKGDYAKYVELGTRKQKANHMLKNAVVRQSEELRKIAEVTMKNTKL